MKIFLTLILLSAISLVSPVQAVEDKVLTVVSQFEIQGPEPSTSGYIFTRMGVAETLIDADGQGRLTPALATQWSVSEDGLVWRFTLRGDVRFHDGTAMTSAAVVNALEIARSKPGPLGGLPIKEIQAGDGEIIISLSDVLATLPAFLAEFRTQILAPASYGTDGAGLQIIGTGPYRITLMEPPLRLQAEAFEDYWGQAAYIREVGYQNVSRVETRALMAESGEAEIVYALDPASVTRLSSDDRADIQSVAIPRTLLIKTNVEHPFLSEPEARRALSLAIDREGIARAVLRYPEGADQLFPPTIGNWHNENLEPLDHDPEQAGVLLASLGWTPGADGILERDGERFELTLLTYPDRPELPLVASVLEQQFRQIGIAVTINSTNSSEIPAGHQDGSLEIALLARSFALVPDPLGVIMQDYVSGGDWGAMGWENPEFVSLVGDLAKGKGGATERAQATAILQEDLPIIPIAWYRQTAAVSSVVEGVVIDPWERSFGLANIRWVP